MQRESPANPDRGAVASRRARAADALAVLGFAVYALLFQLARWPFERPYLLLGGDAALLASWAAALDHPGRFAGDASLADPGHFDYYLTLHVPLLRLLARPLGDYGAALISLLGIHVFLQALGFYALGVALFGRRPWAALLAAVSLLPVDVPLENWRTFGDPLPRFTFQALLPFLLAAAIRAGGDPRRQLAVMLGAGLTFYVHPVSAPPWGLALWLGFAAARPADRNARAHLRHLAGLAAIFLAASAPFVWNYLATHSVGAPSGVPPRQLETVVNMLLPRGHRDAWFAVETFAGRWTNAEGLLWGLAAAGAATLWVRFPEQRRNVATVALWCAALIAVCVGIPLAGQSATRLHGALPGQIDWIRGLRYLVPMALLFCVWPLAALHARARSSGGGRGRAAAIQALALALAGVWAAAHPVWPVRDLLSCWARGRTSCVAPLERSEAEAVEAVRRETPDDARILPTYYAPSLELRYRALRPVVHCYKDAGVFFYADPAALVDWWRVRTRMVEAAALKTPAERLRAHAALARELGADYALVDSSYFRPESPLRAGETWQGQQLVWRNYRFALFRTRAAGS